MLEKAKASNIQNWLEKINTYNSTPGEGTTRVLFTEPELKAREYVKQEMREIGLLVEEDSIGNIFGILEGEDKSLPPVWTGSHIDTVLNAGMFDGMAGVVSGMEALRIIKKQGGSRKRTLAVVVYTSEEPARFGLCCLGSRAMAGHLSREETKNLYDRQGESLFEILEKLGYDLDDFSKIKRRKGEVFGAVELHIEQNNLLDREGIPVGIVDSICAPTNFEVIVRGCQSHAGGTPMKERRDAYAASCEISLVLERMAKEVTDHYMTGTVGKVRVIPNAANVISGEVHFTVDIRSDDFDAKQQLVEQLKKSVCEIEKKRGVRVEMVLENNDRPMICSKAVTDMLEESCRRKNIPVRHMISGAYHDSLFVGEFAPTAMIFVPSKDGISHSRKEWTDFEDIALGTDILADTLFTLSNDEREKL